MATLVNSPAQAKENIYQYEDFIVGKPDLQNRLSMHRAWYAIQKIRTWNFGNSKIVGYLNLTPDEYLKGGFDKRKTEAVLENWFTEVSPNDPLHDELWQALAEFLSKYGKSPSKLARISIANSLPRNFEGQNPDVLEDLIFEVAKRMDKKRVRSLRNRFGELL